MRPKAILSVLVGMALLLSFGVGVKDVKADQILFPWIVKGTDVSTIVSVVNTAGSNLGWSYLGADQILHYQYWYKASTANEQDEVCLGVSYKRPTSKDDIVTFDAARNLNNGLPLFNDDPARYGNQQFGLSAAAPRRAFLIVDNDTPFFTTNADNENETLYGEAMVLELAGGAAWGYIAYNATGQSGATLQTSPVTFLDSADNYGEVIGGVAGRNVEPVPSIGVGEITPMVLLPANVGKTRIFTTPIDNAHIGTIPGQTFPANDNGSVPNQRVGNANVRLQLIYNPTTGQYYGGIFDNDENPIDFQRPKDIVCTAADDISELFTEAAWLEFSATNGQGWAYLDTQTGTIDANGDIRIDNPTDEACVGKLEFTNADNPAIIGGQLIPGTYNTFNWLRNDMHRSFDTADDDYEGLNYIRNVVVDLL